MSTQNILLKSRFDWRIIFITIALTVLILSGGLYYVFGSSARNALIQLTHARTQSIARAGSAAISSYLDLYKNSVTLLARNIENKKTEEKQAVLDEFRQNWRDTIGEMYLTDTKGKVIHASPLTPDALSLDFSDRRGFQWSKTAPSGALFIGEPIFFDRGVYKDKYVILMHTPVFQDGKYNGSLVSATAIADLAEKLVAPLRYSPETRVYIISSKATMLYSDNPKVRNINYLEYLDEHPFFGSKVVRETLKRSAESTQEGQLDVILPNEQKGGLSRFLITFVPIFHSQGHWILAIAIPANEALQFIAPIYVNQIAFLIAAFLSILLLTIVIIWFRDTRRRAARRR